MVVIKVNVHAEKELMESDVINARQDIIHILTVFVIQILHLILHQVFKPHFLMRSQFSFKINCQSCTKYFYLQDRRTT